MLRELRIRHFTIIDHLAITLEPGLTVLSGETGAGKSIIVDAIGLLLGDRASPEMVKTGERDASVEAYFDTAGVPLLRELAIGSDDGVILRRIVALHGKSRAFVNDTPVSIQTLAAVGKCLVTIHGQHEHQELLRKENHLLFLDALGRLLEPAGTLRTLYNEITTLRNSVARMKELMRERTQRIAFLKFQIDEIDAAGLREGQKESLEEERRILANLSKLREASETAYRILYESEGSCLERLFQALNRVKEMAAIDPAAGDVLTLLESSQPLIDDAAAILRRHRDRYDIEPDRLTAIDERLDLIRKLEKKYGGSVSEIVSHRSQAEEELRGLEQIDEQLETLERQLAGKEGILRSLSQELSDKRRLVAGRLEDSITEELQRLGFEKAVFKIEFKAKESITAQGIDDVEFLFSANPGEPPKPLTKVASGGELSRIMLALKCIEISERRHTNLPASEDALAGGENEGTELAGLLSPVALIFDEVDAGIGGVTAQRVGDRLKAIAALQQVLCITHLSQIAALADTHLKVEKTVVGDRVKVSVEHLSGDGRQREIAKMLSGRITEGSLKHAQELLSVKRISG